MRIGIDARYLSHGLVGGIHTYVTNLLPELIELATEDRIVLYTDAKRPFELGALPGHVDVRTLSWRSPLSSLANDLTMARRMARDALDVAHFPANYGFAPSGVPAVVTLHDALNVHPLREMIRGLGDANLRAPGDVAKALYLHALTRLTVHRAALVLTVSRHARQEIARYGGIEPERLVVVPHGTAPELKPLADPTRTAEVRRRYGVDGAFVLADALKNPVLLLEAWRLLDAEVRRRHQIVFFSRRPAPLPAVHEAARCGAARLLVRPPREDLIALYSMAAAFVFPSWLEGFGLPVLEAMACGAPVVASNRAAIPEVAGDAALLTDCDDPAGLARNLTRVLCDAAEASRLRERGLERAARFSWRGAAAQTLEAYRRAADRGPEPGRR